MNAHHAQIPNYRPEGIRRRAHQLALFLYACALVGCVGMVIGAGLNDRTIESDPGRALAKVTDVSRWRTTVEYQDEEGIYHSPATGLLYPTGLGEGQRVWVTYAKSDPDLVKVEGRKWTLSFLPATSTAAVVTIVFGLIWWIINLVTRRFIARKEKLRHVDMHPEIRIKLQ
ncbi:DUF3592 domain-containing protein [Corynebacterium sp. SCR221107]|uniref:DUF3592 domain-containing protein n=1 Tax=Corynebacterium sp. SCR221107 TaxID=3017361 RepID=UPI0022EC3FBE|nr:DUF3592 domain-containing protein [Corynebacterium sp. SCR221107]WBT09129.1 DUF3592 domain-containing protein [Corynebacterium sp. SCR221107]